MFNYQSYHKEAVIQNSQKTPVFAIAQLKNNPPDKELPLRNLVRRGENSLFQSHVLEQDWILT